MITLGIETSCDETAVAVTDAGMVLSSEVSSSVHLHAEYGGVVPEIASRYHTEYIYPVFKSAIEKAKIRKEEIGLIAVTQGPGLPGSLLVGLAFAKALGYAVNTPVVGVDHVKAHIFSCFLDTGKKDMFPFLGVVVSGGHTSIYVCRSFEDLELIGRTKDDAVGEAFDKIAKILGLGYPGGSVIEKRAADYDGKDDINFPRALLQDPEDIDFSFSGIKTAVLYHWKASTGSDREKDRICFSFQKAAIDVLVKKIERAMDKTGIDSLVVGGGVINNERLRTALGELCERKKVRLFLPEKRFCGDNAAMIAGLGEEISDGTGVSPEELKAEPSGLL